LELPSNYKDRKQLDALQVGLLAQASPELEVSGEIRDRTLPAHRARKACQNGYWKHRWGVRVEDCSPRWGRGTYNPSLLEPWGRVLLSLVQKACAHGVSIRKVDGLVRSFMALLYGM